MIVVHDLETRELYMYTSGRGSTPFSTFNHSSAKSMRTKLINNTINKEFSILTIDVRNHSMLLDLNQITLRP